MGKKEKSAAALSEDFKTLIKMIPKLEDFIKAHNEITAEYQKYRKNGGDAIPGIEKHLGIKKQESAPSAKKSETNTKKEAKASKEVAAVKKTKK